ncbi:MAG: methyl-accepting chemotaxis protein, partial [Kangiellaceae bacterium]|nr:methyl-accepting chemotaxis protein [Kangiellaceae bacterium]
MNRLTKVSSKLVFLAGTPLVVLGGIIFSIMFFSAETNKESQRTIETRLNQTQILNSIIRSYTHNIIDVAHKARSGMLLWSDAENTVATGSKSIATNWKALQNFSLNQEEKKLINESRALYQKSLEAIEKLEGYIEQQSSYSMGNFVDLELYSSLDPLLDNLDKMVLLQKQLASTEMEETTSSASQLNFVLSLVTGAVILAVVLLASTMIRSIKSPLSHLQRTMQAIEKQSNLSLRVEVDSKDEFAEIGQSFNLMMDRISQLVNSILESGELLDRAAENMISACQQASNQTSATQDELSSAATSVEQMTQTAVSIQQFTQQTAQATQEADQFVA